MKFIQFILANLNSMDHIEILIKSLRTFHPGFSYEILACDNGSTDGSDEYLDSLDEVKLWKIKDRPHQKYYNKKQEKIVEKYGLENYLHPYFKQKIIEDYRTSHAASINFLVNQIEAPLFATLDTDIEFLGPHWIEPFLLPFILDNEVSAVGNSENTVQFQIGKFKAFTMPRLHPCLCVFRTNSIQNAKNLWDADYEHDLRMLIIQKCLEENVLMPPIQLGDVGYRAVQFLCKNKKVINLEDQKFFSSVRHFYGTTVKNNFGNKDWYDWYNNIKSNPKLKDLVNYVDCTLAYTKLNIMALDVCKKYWVKTNPPPVVHKSPPLMWID